MKWGAVKCKTMRSCAVQVWCNAHGKREEQGRAAALAFVERQRSWLYESEYMQIVDELQLVAPDTEQLEFMFIFEKEVA